MALVVVVAAVAARAVLAVIPQDPSGAVPRDASVLSDQEISRLVDDLTSQDEAAARRAADVLERATGHASEISNRIAPLLDDHRDAVVTRTLHILTGLGHGARAAEPRLLAGLARAPITDSKLSLRLRALGSIGADPAAMAAAFRSALAVADDPIHSREGCLALRGLDPSGRWAIPILVAVLESPEEGLLARAAEEVGKFGSAALPACQALLSVLARYEGSETHDHLANAIYLHFRRGRPLEVDGSFAESTLLAYRNPLLWAIAQMGVAADASVGAVLAIAASGHLALRPDALRTVAMIDRSGTRAARAAVDGLASASPLIRLAAIDAVRLLAARGIRVEADLYALMPAARPYELRTLCRTIEVIGLVPEQASATRRSVDLSRPGPDSAAAVHRCGVAGVAGDATARSILNGLNSRAPWFRALCAMSLGRIRGPTEEKVGTLLATLEELSAKERRSLWDNAAAGFVCEALGRLSREDRIADRIAEYLNQLDRLDVAFDPLSGAQAYATRGYCMIRPPHGVKLRVQEDRSVDVATSWWAAWQQEPRPAVLPWTALAADGTVWIECGEAPGLHADWSTAVNRPMSQPVLLGIKLGLTPAAALVEWSDAIAWARGSTGAATDGFRGELRIRATDVPSARWLEFLVLVEDESSSLAVTMHRWRAGIRMENPWEESTKIPK